MGWKASQPDQQHIVGFQDLVRSHRIFPIFVHTPYLLNLASPNEPVHSKTIAALIAAMEFAASIGAPYVVTHIGSHLGAGVEAGIAAITRCITDAMEKREAPIKLLLENSPGSRNEMGNTFEEYRMILQALDNYSDLIGVCLDTAHLWGAGYDISTAAGVETVLADFHRRIGIEHLFLIHANDSTVGLGSRRDIHQIPGEGLIGLEGFRALVNHPWLADMSFIMEMPRVRDEDCRPPLDALKRLRAS